MKKLWGHRRKIFGYSVLLFVVYGFLPVNFLYFLQNYDKPNVLLIRYQDCTACPLWIREKGNLDITPDLKLRYPYLTNNNPDLNLVHFPSFNDKAIKDYDVSNPEYIVTGFIVGADPEEDDPSGHFYVARFYVQDWHLGSYCARCWTFNVYVFLLWVILLFTGLPIIVIAWAFGKKRKTKAEQIENKGG